MSIRAKLLTLLLMFVLPTIGLMVIFNMRMIASYQEQAVVFQKGTIKMVANDMQSIVNQARQTLSHLSRNENQLLSPVNCPKLLALTVDGNSLFSSLIMTDPKGNVICFSGGYEPPSNVAYQPGYKAAIGSGEFVVTDNYNTSTGKIPELVMGYPVREESGILSGVLIGYFDVDRFSGVWEASDDPFDVQINILNRKGYVINKPIKQSPVDNATLEKIAAGVFANSQTFPLENRTVNITGSDNNERTFRFARLDPNGNYFVSVGFPEGELITEARNYVVGNVVVVSLLTLVILLIAYGSTEISLIKPIKRISQTVESLANGNLKARINLVRSDDEIGRLSKAFDHMADSLEKNLQSIEEETNAKMASQEKFFRLFEDSILGIFQLSAASQLVEVNPALAKMFGYASPENMMESINDPADSLFINDSEKVRIRGLLADRQPVQFETTLRKKDGTSFFGNMRMWGVWDASGTLVSMEGFVEDITINKTIQNQLVKLSQAVEQNPIGIVMSDGQGVIEYANHGVDIVFGYTPKEIIGQSIMCLVPETMSEEELELMRQAIRKGNLYKGEIRNIKKNGEPFWERFVLSPISGSKGEVVSTLCLLEDVTEQNQNRERITQQVEELSALRTIDLAISSNLDLQATLNIIAQLAVKHLRVDGVWFQLYDSRFNILHSGVHLGFQHELPEHIPFPAAADLSDWELVEEFSIHIPDHLKEKKGSHKLTFPASDEFNACFGLPLVAKSEVKGLFRVFLKEPFKPEQHWLDFFYNLATQAAVALDSYELFRNLKQSNLDLLEAYEATIEGWSKALNYRDQETEEHSARTTDWTVELAREMGFSEEELVHIRRGALLHDIGKVYVPDRILNKPGPLTDDEWIVMKKHPQAAHDVLFPIKFLNKSLDIPYCHHERWDGTGYPRGLKGQEIPLSARIFSVIDVYDALTSDRPYRLAWEKERVIQYLRDQSGKHFDPEIVEAFLAMLEKQKNT